MKDKWKVNPNLMYEVTDGRAKITCIANERCGDSQILAQKVCSLLNTQLWEQRKSEAIKKVFEELDALSDKEFKAEIEKQKGTKLANLLQGLDPFHVNDDEMQCECPPFLKIESDGIGRIYCGHCNKE